MDGGEGFGGGGGVRMRLGGGACCDSVGLSEMGLKNRLKKICGYFMAALLP